MALDALEDVDGIDTETECVTIDVGEVIEALRARLLNEFNPDWDATAIMVEEQQRMAKRIEELEAALAQPEQEPVAWISHNAGLYHGKPDESLNPLPLYTTPPQRKFIGLTDEEIGAMEKEYLFGGKEFDDEIGYWAVYRAIEAKLKEKNT